MDSMQYSVIGVVSIIAVLSAFLLVTEPSETGQTVKPFAKIYMDPARAYARTYQEDAMEGAIPYRTMKRSADRIPSLMKTSCDPGYVKYSRPFLSENRECYTSETGVKCCKRFESDEILEGYGVPNLPDQLLK